jgi:hypothetical protein
MNSFYEMYCSCGKQHIRPIADQAFTCDCGKKSVIDWARNLDTDKITRLLNGLDILRDRTVKELENRRQRVA